ncbi:MAG: hypothetical protein A3F70_11960 [Acidobacteria bacterium RIFCSPLOWO2_12_FULL_67_14]|nr:MAG: hypothetical protein A3H29_08325 [Acidobacteria bacterium RIFCSPLOWO2_02_FULL_67_21]OFW38678.1 MAG: hypothetical protein A3F70_11960 [Acidobacteria bacterium RIFCSPLOWO2_12_FULL_67_14]
MTEPSASNRVTHDLVHEFKNHLAVIVGFCDLLLRELPDTDPRREDVLQMQKAGRDALALLPRLTTRMP